MPWAKWCGVAVAFALLAYGSALVFLAFERHSHSASDTLRPFVPTVAPMWAIGVLGAVSWLRRRPAD